MILNVISLVSVIKIDILQLESISHGSPISYLSSLGSFLKSSTYIFYHKIVFIIHTFQVLIHEAFHFQTSLFLIACID